LAAGSTYANSSGLIHGAFLPALADPSNAQDQRRASALYIHQDISGPPAESWCYKPTGCFRKQ